MITDNLKLKGELTIVVKDKDGKVKEQRNETNLVVATGLEFISSRMVGVATPVMSHMAVGSSTTAPLAGQTDLQSMLGSRIAIRESSATDNTVTYICDFVAGSGTGAITEAAIFNNSDPSDTQNSNLMLCRTTFGVVNKSAEDSMVITWTITLSASE